MAIQFKGQLSDDKNHVTVNLAVFSFKEGDVYILYSPALDLQGYGYSEQEARESFQESIREFIKYTINKSTLEKELRRLGWAFRKRKKTYNVPDLADMIRKRDYLQEIVNEKDFMKVNQQVQIPAMA